MKKYLARLEDAVGLQTVVADSIQAETLDALKLGNITLLFDSAKQNQSNFESLNVIIRFCGNVIREIFGNVVFVEGEQLDHREELSEQSLRKLLDGSHFGWIKTNTNKKVNVMVIDLENFGEK